MCVCVYVPVCNVHFTSVQYHCTVRTRSQARTIVLHVLVVVRIHDSVAHRRWNASSSNVHRRAARSHQQLQSLHYSQCIQIRAQVCATRRWRQRRHQEAAHETFSRYARIFLSILAIRVFDFNILNQIVWNILYIFNTGSFCVVHPGRFPSRHSQYSSSRIETIFVTKKHANDRIFASRWLFFVV